MLDQQTKKRIDDCRNILVGKITDPKSQVEQITIALIYKFMDDMDTEAVEMGGFPTYFVGEYERYSWKNIFSPRIGGDEMLSLYGEGMVKMNLNPSLPQLFRDIFKNAYLPYRDPETLKLFLRTINEFKYDHSERLGDAFEYLLSVLGSQGDAGQFRTPRHIIDFLVNIIDPKKNETMMDPACGTSGFLISGFKHILNANTNNNIGDRLTPDERKKLTNNITGFDISPDMVRLSLVNLFLHGFTNPRVYEYDTLTSEDRWNEYYDVILANPPFMSPKGGIRPHKRFGVESNRAEVLFVDYIMEHLTPNGRAGIVVPEGIIFQTGTAYKSLRKMMVEKYLVGVISLPSGVFNPYSGVKTSILVFDRGLSQKTDKIFFGKVENDGYDLGSQRREIEKNDLPIITKEVSAFLEGLRIDKFVESNILTYVSKEEILGSGDIGLSYDRYSIAKQNNTNYPIVSLSELVITKPQYGSGAKKTKYNGTTRYIRITDITEDGKLKNDEIVSPDIIEEECFLEYNDILIARSASVGRCYIHKEKYGDNQYAGYLIRFNLDRNKILPDYFFYLTKGAFYKEWITQMKKDGTISNINAQEYLSIKIPLPPIKVQEEIVRELEQYQKIIDGAKQVVDNYKPVIDIDPNWEVKELGKLCEITSSKRIFQEEYVSEGIPFYRTKEIVELNKGEEIKLELFISHEKYQEIKSKYEIPKKGDILLSAVGTIGVSYLINNDKPFYFKDGNLLWLRKVNNSIISSYFLKKSLDVVFSGDYKKYTNGAAYSALTIITLKKIEIPVPPFEIQQSIVDQIEKEREIIVGNKKLIEIYTQKIQDRINKIWGE
jgi:type I restriction enzyme M protein